MAKSGPRHPSGATPHAPRSKPAVAAQPSKHQAQSTSPALVTKKALQAKEASVESDYNPSESVPILLQVTVGKNLRAARLAAGLTLRQVAELSGILFQYVSKIENGEKNLTLSTIDNLARILRVDVSDLLRKNPP